MWTNDNDSIFTGTAKDSSTPAGQGDKKRAAEDLDTKAAKRRNERIAALVLALAALATLATMLTGRGGHEQAAYQASAPVTVTYEAESDLPPFQPGDNTPLGETGMGSVTYSTNSGIQQQQDVDLPLTRKADGGAGIQAPLTAGSPAVFSVQNSRGFGSVTCRIKASDGTVLAENTSRGGYAIASCNAVAR